MVSAGDKDNVPIGHGHGFIQKAVICVNPLETKPVGWVEPVIVGFFQIGNAREIIFVVAVAWIG